jgi:ankyrin repeat protein
VKRIVIILSMLVLGSYLAKAIDQTGDIYAAIKNEDVAKVKAILAANPNAVNSVVEKKYTPLHFAAEHGSSNGMEILKLLLDKGAKVEARNHIGQTPLFGAVACDNPEGARILIAEGAKVNARQDDGRTPLNWAAANGYCDVAKILIANKANKKARDSNGNTPLGFALEGRSEAKGNPNFIRQYDDMIALLQEKTDKQ